MKIDIKTLACFFLITSSVYAQEEKKENLIVWGFTARGEISDNNIQERFQTIVPDVLIHCDEYEVRLFGEYRDKSKAINIKSIKEQELIIQEILVKFYIRSGRISPLDRAEINGYLDMIKTDVVLMGNIHYQTELKDSSNAYELSIWMVKLDDLVLLGSDIIGFSSQEILNVSVIRRKITRFLKARKLCKGLPDIPLEDIHERFRDKAIEKKIDTLVSLTKQFIKIEKEYYNSYGTEINNIKKLLRQNEVLWLIYLEEKIGTDNEELLLLTEVSEISILRYMKITGLLNTLIKNSENMLALMKTNSQTTKEQIEIVMKGIEHYKDFLNNFEKTFNEFEND